jgi:recombinational DNA repair protein RecR
MKSCPSCSRAMEPRTSQRNVHWCRGCGTLCEEGTLATCSDLYRYLDDLDVLLAIPAPWRLPISQLLHGDNTE